MAEGFSRCAAGHVGGGVDDIRGGRYPADPGVCGDCRAAGPVVRVGPGVSHEACDGCRIAGNLSFRPWGD